MGRGCACVEYTHFPPWRRFAVFLAPKLRRIDPVVHCLAAGGDHRELAPDLFGYVIAYRCHQIYVTQALLKDRWPALGVPLAVQLQNYFGSGIESPNHWQILRAVL